MKLQEGIFPIEKAEHPQVVDVWEASVRATHDFLEERHIQLFKPLILNEYLDLVELASVRQSDGAIAGFLGVAEGKIEMLFIDPAWRGQGIGRKLLHHAVNVWRCTLVDVNEQNIQAVGFYKRMGFIVEGRSAVDGMGKPFPLLHMRLETTL